MEILNNIDSFFKGWAVGLTLVAAMLFTSCVVPCGNTEVISRDGFGRIYKVTIIDDCTGYRTDYYYGTDGEKTEEIQDFDRS